MRTTVVLVAVLCTVAAGCSDGPELETRASSSPSIASLSPTPSPSAEPRQMLVPVLVSLSLAQAQVVLGRRGLRARVRPVAGTACLPANEVLAQEPAPNTKLPMGGRVTIEVNSGAMRDCGAGLPSAPPELSRVARLFERFAVGRADAPPADTPIALLLGGVEQRVIPRKQQPSRRQWRVCPQGGSYAGATCPFSAVHTIRDHVGPVAVTTRPPRHPCAHPTPVGPGAVGATYSVVLTPDENLSCVSYWAVQLFVNDVGQVVAVNLVMSEP